jgi:hypothetical protein
LFESDEALQPSSSSSTSSKGHAKSPVPQGNAISSDSAPVTVETYDEWGGISKEEDPVARRLRIAAEQEKDPDMKKSLRQEYLKYLNEQLMARLKNEEEVRRQVQRDDEYQADVQAEQQRRAQERQQAFYFCLAGTREPTFVGALARCNAEVARSMRAVTDYEWDWDEFYDQYGNLVWMCRGVQTAQFVELSRCSDKYQTDTRWPNK